MDHNAGSLTPVMQQYVDIKKLHKEAIVLFRLGDFYEIFFEDAVIASKELDIVLTARGKYLDKPIDMCGIPHHASKSYISQLVKKNYKVVICEQTETPEEAKARGAKFVDRKVAKIITPGTICDESLIDSNDNNFLVAICPNPKNLEEITVSWCETSTGEFYTATLNEPIQEFFAKIQIAEILCIEDLYDKDTIQFLRDNYKDKITFIPAQRFKIIEPIKMFNKMYHGDASQIVKDFSKSQQSSIALICDYIYRTFCENPPKLNPVQIIDNSNTLKLNYSAFESLEILKPNSKYSTSLLATLDETITAPGSRFLKTALARPSTDIDLIYDRYDAIDFFIQHKDIYSNFRTNIKNFPDLHRVLSRLSTKDHSPRDLVSVKTAVLVSQKTINEFYRTCKTTMPNCLKQILKLEFHDHIFNTIDKAIIDNPPALTRDGNFVRENFNDRVDLFRKLINSKDEVISNLENKYKDILQIPSLKIKRTNIIGLFVEVPSRFAQKLIEHELFTSRQTLVNVCRFLTKELIDIEAETITVKNQLLAIELEIYDKVVLQTLEAFWSLRSVADVIAEVDFISSLTALTFKFGYKRPVLDNSTKFSVKGAEHPVLQNVYSKQGGVVVPNDIILNDEDTKKSLWILTGPNMGGKSTFLRTNALLIVMAQIGSFIPVSSAEFGIVDRLFTRIGASDNLIAGQSTFMLEMMDIAYMLTYATKNSFVVLDEMGRGTSTYDGMALAWSVIETLAKEGVRTLFATHYHELTELAKPHKNIGCYTPQIVEENDAVSFLYKIIPGNAGSSFGLYIAKLAGVNKDIITRAEKIQASMEKLKINLD
ncbi:MAG: DNA mismatch repair protein MutS [Alphaproteobacteria bacterium]|nr:DNA mismatch repair protein MutS [Alphaproteobacteria bacterium]